MFPELPSASIDIENRNLMKNCLQNTRQRAQMVENHLVADAEAFKQSHDSLKHIMVRNLLVMLMQLNCSLMKYALRKTYPSSYKYLRLSLEKL